MANSSISIFEVSNVADNLFGGASWRFLILLFLPLFSFILIFLSQTVISAASRAGRLSKLSPYFYYCFVSIAVTIVCSGSILSSLVCSTIVLYVVLTSGPVYVALPLGSNWIFWESYSQYINFQFDTLSGVMLVVITFISLIVHLYSFEYLGFDPFYMRFMSFLNLFTFFMMLLVTAGNIVQMFVGWEGVGLSSYLLINFWFTRLEANKSSFKAIAMNRLGDTALVSAIFVFVHAFGTASFPAVFAILESFKDEAAALPVLNILGVEASAPVVIAWFVLVASIAKSAQLGLHTWLPDAMEGPTPVSALLHAATMVTAGVYTIVRFSFVFEYAPAARNFCAIVGALTALFGSLVALTQFDIKRVVAFSTTSQLGYMFVACGLSGYHIAMYHLVTHAFFKAFLFLVAGVIIHNMNNEQDFRRMGCLARFAPLTYVYMLVGFLSLSGMPFMSGFYSKDAIIELAYSGTGSVAFYAFCLCSIAAVCTAAYSVRVLYLTFFSSLRVSSVYKGSFRRIEELSTRIQTINEISYYFLLVLAPLFIGSICAGWFLYFPFVGLGSPFWGSSFLFKSGPIYYEFFVPGFLKIVPILLSFLGYFIAYAIYSRWIEKLSGALESFPSLRVGFGFIGRKWLFDAVYNKFFSVTCLKVSRMVYVVLDKGYFEYFGAYGLSRFLYRMSYYLEKFFSKFGLTLYSSFFVAVMILCGIFLGS